MSEPRTSLVIGAGGQVGRACRDALAASGDTVHATSGTRTAPGLRPLELGDERSLRALIDELRPQRVVLCAALTDVERCEREHDTARRLNAEPAAWAAEECAALGAPLAFVSSEYVFDGVGGPFSEDDEPKPINVYGQTKLEAERAVLGASEANLVVRTTVVSSWQPEGRNWLMGLWRTLAAGRHLRVPSDQVTTPTNATDLAAAIVGLLDRGRSGLWHAAGPDRLPREEAARLAAEVLELDASLIDPVATAELGQRARRPLDAGLATRKLQAELGDLMRPLRETIEDVRRQAHAAGVAVPP